MNGQDIKSSETPVLAEPFTLERTEVFALQDGVWGDEYRISLALPEGEAPDGGWPSIYLLDATGSFGTCVEALRRMARRPSATGVEQMAVIGISAASGYDVVRRQRDYTTPRSGVSAEAGKNEGGAAQFLDFIESSVQPAAASRLSLNPNRRTLYGHSLAGYFSLWAMTARPGSFRACAAISPSIWWDKDALMEAAGRLSGQDCDILMAFGEWEDALPPWQKAAPDSDSVRARRQARGMISGGMEVAEQLSAALGGERVRLAVLPEEDHASIVTATMPRVLRLASQA